jgi:hypothetical protein
MNVDRILAAFNKHEVVYLLIGGVNFLLRHKPVLTFDVDFWVEDTEPNLRRCESALAELGAEWGPTEQDWGSVARRPAGWLSVQSVYCLNSPHGAIDIFRTVAGLPDWRQCQSRAVSGKTTDGTVYQGISDADMLQCQLSLDPHIRKLDRIRDLQQALASHG